MRMGRRPYLLMGAMLVAVAAFLTAPTVSWALPVYGTDASAELTGSRDVDPGGGLTGFGQYQSNAPNDPFTVSWEITLGPTIHYKYTFTGLDVSGQEKEISNFVIDLSLDCDGDADCVTNPMVNGLAIDMNLVLFGDFNGLTESVKFDVGGGEGIMYEFDSNRLPVYGHLAIKDGGGPGTCPAPGSTTAACSNGLVAGVDTMDVNDYVARPNGIVPEPGTAALLAMGLTGLALRARRR